MKRKAGGLLLFACMILLMSGYAYPRVITIVNNSGQAVCPGIQGSQNPKGGGWCQNNGASVSITVPDDWTAARIWGRTGCNVSTGSCLTGDCGDKIACGGSVGNPPATLAEFTLRGAGGLDYYDVSLMDGYNLPVTIQNVGGKKYGDGTKYDCGTPACVSDLNQSCPSVLQLVSGGKVIACKSACLALNSDRYCCRGAYGTPETCGPSAYSKSFHEACPDAYSYAYDDDADTFKCVGGDYQVIFGVQQPAGVNKKVK